MAIMAWPGECRGRLLLACGLVVLLTYCSGCSERGEIPSAIYRLKQLGYAVDYAPTELVIPQSMVGLSKGSLTEENCDEVIELLRKLPGLYLHVTAEQSHLLSKKITDPFEIVSLQVIGPKGKEGDEKVLLGALPELKFGELQLENVKISPSVFQSMQKLQETNPPLINDRPAPDSLATHLYLTNCEFAPGTLKKFAELKRLYSLSAKDLTLNREFFTALSPLGPFGELSIADAPILDDGQGALSPLPTAKSIWLKNTNYFSLTSPPSSRYQWKKLQHFTCEAAGLNDVWLQTLYRTPTLTQLSIKKESIGFINLVACLPARELDEEVLRIGMNFTATAVWQENFGWIFRFYNVEVNVSNIP